MNLFKGVLNISRIKSLILRKNRTSKLGDRWARSYDIYGHKPKFDIICQFCSSKLMLRYTQVIPDRSRLHCVAEGINSVAYKCPRCHVMYKFFIPDDTDYLKDIFMNKRDGIDLYLPPKDVWEKENEEIKERLRALGYM